MTSRSFKIVAVSIATCLMIFSIAASAATETIIHNFNRMPGGGNPNNALIADAAGNLYGVTPKGGANGVVFRLSKNAQGRWIETVLHNFIGGVKGPDGMIPEASLLLDAAGNLYGTTQGGGTLGCGIAFRLSPTASGPWKETILHTFACYPVDGSRPSGALIADSLGNLYGVTLEGGSGGCNDTYTVFGCGTVYELSPNAGGYTETVLDSFGTTTGLTQTTPSGPLAMDSQGNLYGTAEAGGTAVCSFYGGCGTVFKLTKTGSGWTESTIYSLTGGADGDTPVSGVFFDAAGNLYGTGAGYYNFGGVFILSPNADGTWSEASPFTFTPNNFGLWVTNGNVVRDSAGNLYGAAELGGTTICAVNNNGCGGIYKLTHGTSGWAESNLYSFTNGTDGSNPAATLLRDSAGNLFTTTINGGQGAGSVFELSPASGGSFNGHVLYDFPVLSEGMVPYSGLTPDGLGNYYGTTSTGGINAGCIYFSGCGTVFKLSPNGKGGWLETVIYAFTGKNGDGLFPTGNLLLDASGNLYGTTSGGGVFGYCSGFNDTCGTVFKLSPNGDGTWTETVLHAFTGYTTSDGGTPAYGLVMDANGNLYGTTPSGGAKDCGVVFELSPTASGPWTEAILHDFGSTGDIPNPSSPLIFDQSGNLYGTSYSPSGGTSSVYRLSPTAGGWTESFLFTFTNSNTSGGFGPHGNIAFDAAGNLIAATVGGGKYNDGVVFKLTPTTTGPWTETVLYNFKGVNGDGYGQSGGVTLAGGNIFGTTQYGGTFSSTCGTVGCGTVFELTPSTTGTWTEHVLHRFSGGTDGTQPRGSVIVDALGNVFGTASGGGSGASGVIFEIKP